MESTGVECSLLCGPSLSNLTGLTNSNYCSTQCQSQLAGTCTFEVQLCIDTPLEGSLSLTPTTLGC